MYRFLILFSALFLLISCQDINRTPKPDNLIPEEKMVDVLTEISLLHGAKSYNKSQMEEKGIDPYPYLTEKYGIDSLQLVQSNDYYAQNYKQYKRIYDSVKVRLETLVEEYDSIREMEQRKRDSLREKPGKDSLPIPRRRFDSLIPLRMEKPLPAPVSRQQ
ncbi:DUF4296 domain-containing protein [Salinimicrobium sp. HB62]|uniref:DUF4296 domain-containing protein n=1 Tax=Salinimicrobium sp. HB62 TaxID=3077781 RepID=UPI002D797940|nr:DUF4296 domain-containing protein [Salinimicrobium sp. HB62]